MDDGSSFSISFSCEWKLENGDQWLFLPTRDCDIENIRWDMLESDGD